MPNLPPNTPQLLFDEAWIDESRRLVRRWLPADVLPQPVLVPDQPWEGPAIVLFGSVLPDPAGGWRMYYQNFVPAFMHANCQPAGIRPYTMVASSQDALTWHKPGLDVLPLADGTPTNRVLERAVWDSPNVLYEPSDSGVPWKLISFSADMTGEAWSNDTWGIHAFTSHDGLHWSPLREDGKPVLVAGDRTNLIAERVEGEYWAYTRHQEMWKQIGLRGIYLTRSPDFRQWTEPELVLAPDLSDEPDVEFYGMPVFRRHGWFIGLLEYWQSDLDRIEVHLTFSRDGRSWQRPSTHVAFIAGQYSWNSNWSSCASTGPVIINEDMIFYFGGRRSAHHYTSATLDGALGYAVLPVDRFCALEAGHYPGTFTTPAFSWPGGDLELNADTRRSFASHPATCTSEITVEVLAPDGEPLPDWSGSASAHFHGNTHSRGQIHSGTVLWPKDRSLAALTAQALRLRFTLEHARLFTFAATEASPPR